MRGVTVLISLTLVLGVLELALRLRVNYDPGYYMALKDPDARVLEYPWGRIVYNADGHPDHEFRDQKERPRIVYIGDSVCAGLGAGHGYRVTEVMDGLRPQFEHMNNGRMAAGISSESSRAVLEFVDRFGVDTVVYLMNLNDIRRSDLRRMREAERPYERIRRLLDQLRGRSYLYSHLRFSVAKIASRWGVRHDGRQAAELFPSRYEREFRETAERVNALAASLHERGVPLVVVLLPYEMQISEGAARAYAEYGIRWDGTFIDRGPQKKIAPLFRPDIRVIDAYYAFVREGDESRSRRENELGEHFVYDRGDKLDWNHPNRAGHRAIAEYLAGADLLPSAGL